MCWVQSAGDVRGERLISKSSLNPFAMLSLVRGGAIWRNGWYATFFVAAKIKSAFRDRRFFCGKLQLVASVRQGRFLVFCWHLAPMSGNDTPFGLGETDVGSESHRTILGA